MSTNASAQTVSAFEDGNSLYERCAEPTATFSRGVCLGYVVGIFDAMLSAGGTPIAGFSVCLPRGVTKGQAFDVVTRFLASHPELRHLTAASLVARALEQAFPCRR
jgi:hypothetical protein